MVSREGQPVTKRPAIAVVIVTYNRVKLLRGCLASLLGQMAGSDQVFVIDNASTDGTQEMMEAEYTHQSVTYVREEENRGGSAGFHRGMERAYTSGFEWILLCDDDVEFLPSALASLLALTSVSRCIQSRRLDPEGKPFVWLHRMDPITGWRYEIEEEGAYGSRDYAEFNLACFEGLFLHRSLIDDIGLPDERFFMTEDDALYGILASRVTQVIYTRAFILKRMLTNKREVRGGKVAFARPRSLYLRMRNLFYLEKYCRVLFAPQRVNHKFFILRQALGAAWRSLLIGEKTLACWQAILGGIWSGMTTAGMFAVPDLVGTLPDFRSSTGPQVR
ncbi:hypothetical protein AUK40_02085 [Candidatus Wirthbacteria bacterium CG2_30_54_11]|uniref:Glycosyltransferase 2-like domain-containing protein n=1 Tax=Candidatus Wirthbacteria bacterium CG2_30_54_11 TaxID=1817892 RepID=A0A1J5J3F1_9BACT|nr:MAG: hypothetical protein AUK40_02085 [Candidatus Wirthbacteria bacterium CG2_30_54_11]